MKKGMVSIIVPFLNGEKYIGNAIDSVLAQIYMNYELLLIDNGSSDNSKKIIDKYKDERIKYFYLDEANVSNARNFGMKQSRGEFTYFMDGDDTIESDCLEKAISTLKEKEVDLVLFNFNKVFKNSRTKVELPWKNVMFSKEELVDKLIPPMISVEKDEVSIMGTVWRFITYTKFLQGIEFNKQIKIAEDLLFCLELYSKIDSLYILEDALYNYTLSTSSTLNTSKKGVIYQSITYHEILKEVLIKTGLYNADMEYRFYKNQGRMYTTAISSASRNKDRKVALNEIKEIIGIYLKDDYNYLNLNFPFYIKLSFVLMKLKQKRLLYIIYRQKEKKRLKDYN